MLKRRILLVGVLCVGLVAGVTFALMLRADWAAPLVWESGILYRYHLSYASSGSVENGGESLSVRSSAVSVAGEVLVRKQANGMLRILIDAKKFDFNVDGVALPPPAAPIDLAVSMTARGDIVRFETSPESFVQHGAWLRELLSLLELSLPERPARWWTHVETQAGAKLRTEVHVRYRDMTSVHLRKGYVSAERADPRVMGTFDFTLSTATRSLVGVSGSRTVVTRLPHGAVANSRASLALALVSAAPAGVDVGANAPAVVASDASDASEGDDLAGTHMRELAMVRMYRATLGRESAESMVERLREWDPDADSDADPYQKLKALFVLHPGSAEHFERLAKSLPDSDDRLSSLLSALMHAGTPEAQTLLRNLADAAETQEREERRWRLLMDVSSVERPTAETEAWVRELMASASDESIRVDANFALGNIAHFARAFDLPRAEKILSEYGVGLTNSTGTEGVLRNLGVIGNIGLPGQLAIVRPYLNHDAIEVRWKALNALRFVDTDDARAILVAALNADNDRTREIAVRALSFTPGNAQTVNAYRAHLFQEKDAEVVKGMLSNLRGMRNEFPEAQDIIGEFVASCGVTDLCDFAQGLQDQG